MHRPARRLSIMIGTGAIFMVLAFVTSVTLSQAAEPTAPVSSQKKAVKKGDPDLVQEPTVSLTQAVHFTDATGQDVVVGPGSYRVEAEGTNRIHLVPTETGKAVVIDAVSFTHEQPVERPDSVTTSDPQQPDVLHLALLLPGGRGVGAVGTYSGVKPRGPIPNWGMVFAPNRYSYKPAPGVRDHRKSGGMALRGNTVTAIPGYELVRGTNNQVSARRAGGGGLGTGLGLTTLTCNCDGDGTCRTSIDSAGASCKKGDGTCTAGCRFSSVETGVNAPMRQ